MIKPIAKIVFTLFLLSFSTIFLFLTFGLGRNAGLVPLWVAIPTSVLLFIQLIMDFAPKTIKNSNESRHARFSVYGNIKGGTRPNINTWSMAASRDLHENLRILMWIIWMLVSIYFLGLLYSIPLYAFLYLKWRAGESWPLSIAIALILWSLLYGFFILVLEKTLYEGQLFVWLGF